MFEAPLLDRAELMSGEYQFVLSDGEDETITYFNYTKEEIRSVYRGDYRS